MPFPGRKQRIWDALITGVPFGIFKAGSGYYLLSTYHIYLGTVFMAWGLIDLALNLAAAVWKRPLPYCLLSATGRMYDRRRGWRNRHRGENFALALDTLLSFLIVSSMIWFHCIPLLGFPLQRIWEAATITQITGVGLNRLRHAVQPPD